MKLSSGFIIGGVIGAGCVSYISFIVWDYRRKVRRIFAYAADLAGKGDDRMRELTNNAATSWADEIEEPLYSAFHCTEEGCMEYAKPMTAVALAVHLNDTHRLSFLEIAAILEKKGADIRLGRVSAT